MQTMKKIFAWVYYWILRRPLLAIAKWPGWIEERLGYCCNGCENCYAWKCTARKRWQTPYKRFRTGKFKG